MNKHPHTAPQPKLYELNNSQPCSGGVCDYRCVAYYPDQQGHAKVYSLRLKERPGSTEAGLQLVSDEMKQKGMRVPQPQTFFMIRECGEHGRTGHGFWREAVAGLIYAYPHDPERIKRQDIMVNEQGLGQIALRGSVQEPLVLLPSMNTDAMADLKLVQDRNGLWIARHDGDFVAIHEPTPSSSS